MPEQPSTRKAELVDPELYAQYQDCDRWAVIVGISKYQHSNLNLRYADCDAEDLYQLLLTPNGGSFQSDHICKLINEQATTGNITRALRSFLKKPAREDLVLIYFACHGSPDPDRPSNTYLLTYDTDPSDIAGTALPMEDIDRALKGILYSEKVIILADTCHSAAIAGGIGGRRSVVDDSKIMNRFFQEISRSKGGVALLTSAEANEVSFEDIKWGGGHGAFTHYLLEGMRGAADQDSNGIVTIGELFEYVRDNVKKATDYRQHPCIGTNAYDRNLPVTISSYLSSSKTSDRTQQTQYNYRSNAETSPRGSRRINDEGLNLLTTFEDCTLEAYDYGIGIWIIGYHHTKGVFEGMTITQAQADQFLREDLERSESYIEGAVRVDINDDQFSALVSFCFNVGSETVGNSTLLRKLNAGDYQGAAEQFLVWNRAVNVPVLKLTRRRLAEQALFLSKPWKPFLTYEVDDLKVDLLDEEQPQRQN